MTNQRHLDALFTALGDPTRRAILARLSNGPARVTDLARPLPMALPTVLQHLRKLEEGGLVVTEKHGRARFCTLRPGALVPVRDWLTEQTLLWEAQTDRLSDFLTSMPKDHDHG